MQRLKFTFFLLFSTFLFACEDQTPQMLNFLLSGDYIITSYSTRTNGPSSVSNTAYAVLSGDGDGSGTYTTLFASNGELPKFSPLPYDIKADGTFIMGDARGIVSADGQVFTMVDADNSTDFAIYVGIKKSSGMTSAILSGDYIVTSYSTRTDGSSSVSNVGYAALHVDGSGNGSYTTLASANGDLPSFSPLPYAVNDDGTFIMGDARGIVSADGQVFTMVDAGNSDDFALYVGIKKSSGMTNAMVKGDGIVTSYGMDTDVSSVASTVYADGSFDGNGLASLKILTASDGKLGQYTGVPYNVNDDGTFVVGDWLGIVRNDGRVFTAVLANDISDFAFYVGISKIDTSNAPVTSKSLMSPEL